MFRLLVFSPCIADDKMKRASLAQVTLPSLVSKLNGRAQVLLNVAAVVLIGMSFAYVASLTARNWHSVTEVSNIDRKWLALSALAYLCAHPFTSASWVLSVRGLGQKIGFSAGLRIGFATQVAKYLPGNVAHYFARAAIARSAGITLGHSGLATALEIVAALLAAAWVVAIATMVDPRAIAVLHADWDSTAAIPAAIAIGAAAVAILTLRFTKIPVTSLAVIIGVLMINFTFVGLSLLCVLNALSTQDVSPAMTVGIFTLAWVAGYLVPGAPAGLGVREAILIAWLGPIVGSGGAVTCTIIHRLTTSAADLAVGVFGYFGLRQRRKYQAGAANRSKK